MFLRKLTVMFLPLLLVALVCLVLPLISGLGFWNNVLKGVLLGISLALLLPLAGASKRREPFAGLLWIPALLLSGVVIYQYLSIAHGISLPVLDLFAVRDGQIILAECTFAAYMAAQTIRTRK